jgi:hypothetical protein
MRFRSLTNITVTKKVTRGLQNLITIIKRETAFHSLSRGATQLPFSLGKNVFPIYKYPKANALYSRAAGRQHTKQTSRIIFSCIACSARIGFGLACGFKAARCSHPATRTPCSGWRRKSGTWRTKLEILLLKSRQVSSQHELDVRALFCAPEMQREIPISTRNSICEWKIRATRDSWNIPESIFG